MLSGDKTETTLHVRHTNFCTFLCRRFAWLQVKLPETSQLHVLWRSDVVCVPVDLFLLPLIFNLVAASSHFLTASIKFSCFSFHKIGLFCFLISLLFKIVKQWFLCIIFKVLTPPYIVWFQKISIPLPWKIIGNSEGEFSWVPSILRGAFTTSTAWSRMNFRIMISY